MPRGTARSSAPSRLPGRLRGGDRGELPNCWDRRLPGGESAAGPREPGLKGSGSCADGPPRPFDAPRPPRQATPPPRGGRAPSPAVLPLATWPRRTLSPRGTAWDSAAGWAHGASTPPPILPPRLLPTILEPAGTFHAFRFILGGGRTCALVCACAAVRSRQCARFSPVTPCCEEPSQWPRSFRRGCDRLGGSPCPWLRTEVLERSRFGLRLPTRALGAQGRWEMPEAACHSGPLPIVLARPQARLPGAPSLPRWARGADWAAAQVPGGPLPSLAP